MMLTLQASREQCPRDLLLDWELLWCEVLQRSRAWLLAHCEYAPTSEQWQAFQGYWRRRLAGEMLDEGGRWLGSWWLVFWTVKKFGKLDDADAAS